MLPVRMSTLVATLLCALATFGQSIPLDQAIADLKNPDTARRMVAAHELWMTSMDNPDPLKAAIPALSDAVLDRDLNIRFMVMSTLKKFGPAARIAVPSLIKALDTFPGGNPPLEGPPRYYPDARSAAAEALGAIGPAAKEAIPALQKATKDPSEDVRLAATDALKRISAK